ncbi:hypothetical protein EBT16_04570 [bacterium]|nr:hypothetical protein [bacterium]
MRILCFLALFVLCLGAFGSTRTVLEVGSGVSTAILGAQPGLHVGARLPIGNSGFYGGLDTGSYFYTTPEFGTYIPILLSASARFDFSQNAHLMLGLAPGIGLINYSNSSKPGGRDYSDVYFTLLIKPAFNLTVSEGTLVMISPSIGTLNGNLLFSPVIGTAIEL